MSSYIDLYLKNTFIGFVAYYIFECVYCILSYCTLLERQWMNFITHSSSFHTWCEFALRRMPNDRINQKSTLVQVMAWYRLATSDYPEQCGLNFAIWSHQTTDESHCMFKLPWGWWYTHKCLSYFKNAVYFLKDTFICENYFPCLGNPVTQMFYHNAPNLNWVAFILYSV